MPLIGVCLLVLSLQVVAFQAMMEVMAEKFPGAFSGYTLKVGHRSRQHNQLPMQLRGLWRWYRFSAVSASLHLCCNKATTILLPCDSLHS